MNIVDETTPAPKKSFRDLANEGTIFFNNVIHINCVNTTHVESSIFILTSLLLAGIREYTFSQPNTQLSVLLAKFASTEDQASLSEALFFMLHGEFYQLMVQPHRLHRVVDMLVKEQQLVERALKLTHSKNSHYPLIANILYRILVRVSVNDVATLEPDLKALAAAYKAAIHK